MAVQAVYLHQGLVLIWMVSMLTMYRCVRDGKHLSPKLIFLDLLYKLASVSHEALDAAVLPVSH